MSMSWNGHGTAQLGSTCRPSCLPLPVGEVWPGIGRGAELAALRALSRMNMMLSSEGASPHISKEKRWAFLDSSCELVWEKKKKKATKDIKVGFMDKSELLIKSVLLRGSNALFLNCTLLAL